MDFDLGEIPNTFLMPGNGGGFFLADGKFLNIFLLISHLCAPSFVVL